MNRCLGITPQKRPDPGDTGSEAANYRMFKGFGAGHGIMSVRSNGSLKRMAIAAMVGIAAVVGCAQTSALAADDDDDNELFDVKIFRGILNGLGLRRDGKTIDYRERSPLVLPRDTTLPPPEKDTVAKTANWPDDPDIKRAKQAKEAKRHPKPKIDMEEEAPFRPDQLDPKGRNTGIRPDNTSGGSIEQASAPSTRVELGAKDLWTKVWAPKEEYQTFTGEPPRTTLIDPPAGYRTPSPNQPFGVGREKWKPVVGDTRGEIVR
jgi:hypothetical protein